MQQPYPQQPPHAPQQIVVQPKKGIGCLGGCLITGVVMALVCGGIIATPYFVEEYENRKRLEAEAAAEGDLRQFAEDQLPQLQRVIHDIDAEIARRQKMLDELADEMRRLHREPTSDPDYQRWLKAVGEMRGKLRELKDKRTDAFLAWRKFELNPDSADDRATREERFRIAQRAAEDGRTTFERLLRDAEQGGPQ